MPATAVLALRTVRTPGSDVLARRERRDVELRRARNVAAPEVAGGRCDAVTCEAVGVPVHRVARRFPRNGFVERRVRYLRDVAGSRSGGHGLPVEEPRRLVLDAQVAEMRVAVRECRRA